MRFFNDFGILCLELMNQLYYMISLMFIKESGDDMEQFVKIIIIRKKFQRDYYFDIGLIMLFLYVKEIILFFRYIY